MQVVNGLNTWVATQDVPAGGDDVVIGGEADVTNAIEFAELPGSSGEASGWIPAKCPLLFGGYSGGVGQGTWSHTGPTAVSGNTWTNSLNTLTLSRGVSLITFWRVMHSMLEFQQTSITAIPQDLEIPDKDWYSRSRILSM
jgi:hypothetical protein